MRYICFKNDDRIKPISAGIVSWQYILTGMKMSSKEATILLGYKGRVRISQKDNSFVLKRGTFYVSFPNVSHSFSVVGEDEPSYLACYFVLPDNYYTVEADEINQVIREGYCVLPEFSEINDCDKSIVLFTQLMDEFYNFSTDVAFKTEICDNFTKILLCTLSNSASRYSGESSRRMSAERIFDWLRLNAPKGVTASEAAKTLNYNADYLNQIIKRETGITLVKYLNTLRIEHAKALLLNSNISISQIASAIGFTDEKYFMKVFKQIENVTPSQYRNSYFTKDINTK